MMYYGSEEWFEFQARKSEVLGENFSNYNGMGIGLNSNRKSYTDSLSLPTRDFRTPDQVEKDKAVQAELDAIWLSRESKTSEEDRKKAGITALDEKVAQSLQSYIDLKKSMQEPKNNIVSNQNFENQQSNIAEPNQKDNTMLYAGLGIGAVLIVGLIYAFSGSSSGSETNINV